MKHYKFENIDWNKIQEEYNQNKNLSIKEILIKYKISRTCIATAIKHGLFQKDNRTFKHSEETKQILSKKQKTFLKKNPDKHPWKRNTKFKSNPCEHLKEELRKNNISFVEEFENFKDHNYSIDIAFPNDKVGIEVNGNQHYNRDGSLTKYYQERQKYIESFGWKLYQIHYSLTYDKTFLELIIKQIKTDLKNLNTDYSFYIPNKEKRICQLCKRQLNYDLNNDHICKKCLQQIKRNEVNEKRKQIVLNSGIEFSKFGWVGKLSKLFNISVNKAGTWVKEHMPEFYKEKCFKRK